MITTKDIAELAGVSPTTVSLVLNNKKHRISQETCDRILRIAQDLGYTPNQIAVSLATRKTNTIGLILPDITNMFLSTITHSVERTAYNHHYGVFLCDADNDVDKTLYYIDVLQKRCVDGIIIIPPATINEGDYPKRCSDILNRCQIPYVLLEYAIHDIFHDFITLDNEMGGYMATKHLRDMGHTRIGCITGPMSEYGARRRLNGYKQVLEESRIAYNPDYVKCGTFQYDSGYQLAQELLATDITAMFVSNDMMAIGAYNALERKGVRIPEDISIVGFDNIPLLETMNIPLTTVNQPHAAMGKKAFEVLLGRIDDPDKPHRDYYFTPSLVERTSVLNLASQ